MRSTELIHQVIELSNLSDSRQLMKLLKELRRQAIYEAVKEIIKFPINELKLSVLPGKVYRRLYGAKITEE